MGMPDVYSPEWLKQVDEAAKRQCAPRKDDRWLLGYFIANEPAWPGREALVADLMLKGPDTATKKALQAFLGADATAATQTGISVAVLRERTDGDQCGGQEIRPPTI